MHLHQLLQFVYVVRLAHCSISKAGCQTRFPNGFSQDVLEAQYTGLFV